MFCMAQIRHVPSSFVTPWFRGRGLLAVAGGVERFPRCGPVSAREAEQVLSVVRAGRPGGVKRIVGGEVQVSRRIPVVLLAGFLGSGKTTLLNHLLSTTSGTRIGVVVNDFGSINVDAMTVAGQVDSMVSLGNGCLCCAVDTSGLDAMLSKLSDPAMELDVIVVEASGLADPRELIRMLLASEDERIIYGGLIQVVDAAEFDTSRARHPELAEHLRFADLVVLNKIDRVDEAGLREVRATIDGFAPRKPVLATTQARVDPTFLFDVKARPAQEGPRQLSFSDLLDEHDCEHEEHLHAVYESVEFTAEEPLDPRALMRFLDSRPAGLYRMKGPVYFGIPGHRQKFTMQTVGNFVRFHRGPWSREEPRHTRLVLIGAGLDAASLREGLRACAAESPADADEYAMLPVLRFTR